MHKDSISLLSRMASRRNVLDIRCNVHVDDKLLAVDGKMHVFAVHVDCVSTG